MFIYRLSNRPRRLLAVVVVVALLALLAIAFAGPGPGPARAAGPAAGMSLQIKNACTDASQLTTVEVGVPFVLCIVSDPAPDSPPANPIAGFTSEVLFAEPETGTQCANSIDDDGDEFINDGCPQVADAPEVGADCLNDTDDEDNDGFLVGKQNDGVVNDGCPARTLNLKWTPRASCEAEVQVGRQDAGMLAVCNAKSTFLGGVGHVVFSEFADLAEPLTVPASSTTTLVELDFTCNVEGSYKLTLTAAPDSPDGAAYADLEGHKLNVKTVLQDYDGDTTANDVADTATFECVGTVGGITELPDVAGTPLETTTSSNGNLGLVVGVAAAMLLALGGAAWYVSRRRFGLGRDDGLG